MTVADLARGSAASILLVEDDETLAGILQRHLRALGYDVLVAETAEAALDALRDGLRPRLIVLDINLPGETGWAVARSSLLAAAGNPAIVIASAVAVNPARLRELHIAGYLPKPFALETLVNVVERLTSDAVESTAESMGQS